jgi:hypothetical protein
VTHAELVARQQIKIFAQNAQQTTPCFGNKTPNVSQLKKGAPSALTFPILIGAQHAPIHALNVKTRMCA